MRNFDLEKIIYSTDLEMYKKALELYEKSKVTEFKFENGMCHATVIGREPYHTSIIQIDYEYGHCDCYMGQKEILCKHMVATAIYSLYLGKPIPKKLKNIHTKPVSSEKTGSLTLDEIKLTKKSFSEASKYIKAYPGSTRYWFSYQASLTEGCLRLSETISNLPVCMDSAILIIQLLLKIDKKLSSGGVDDSDGVVGDFISDTVNVLIDYTQIDKSIIASFELLTKGRTCFGWESELVRIFDEQE